MNPAFIYAVSSFHFMILSSISQHKHKKRRKDSIQGNEDELIVDIHDEDGNVIGLIAYYSDRYLWSVWIDVVDCFDSHPDALPLKALDTFALPWYFCTS